MPIRRAFSLVLAAVLIMALALVLRHGAIGGDRTSPPDTARPNRAHATTLTPAARDVVYAFFQSLASRNRAATRRLVDPTYPCGLSGGRLGGRRRMFFFPLDRTYRKKNVVFRAPVALSGSLIVQVAIREMRATFDLELKERRDRWRVSYFDGVFGSVMPVLCDPAQTSN